MGEDGLHWIGRLLGDEGALTMRPLLAGLSVTFLVLLVLVIALPAAGLNFAGGPELFVYLVAALLAGLVTARRIRANGATRRK
jgi:hypothetical protein